MRAPVLIGAVGGSGTRVIARILAQAGFFIGARRNDAEDSEPTMDFFDRWLRPYVDSGGTLQDRMARLAAADFWRAVEDHRRGIEHADQAWAVKVPRSLLMLPYWCEAFPQIRFIHVIRNGLDMAYSTDNNQLRMFQDLVLAAADQELLLPLRAMAYWRTVNLQAAAIGKSSLGTRYHLVRFEDLCREPQTVIAKLAAFLDIPIDIAGVTMQVSPPRKHRPLACAPHRGNSVSVGYWQASLGALRLLGFKSVRCASGGTTLCV